MIFNRDCYVVEVKKLNLFILENKMKSLKLVMFFLMAAIVSGCAQHNNTVDKGENTYTGSGTLLIKPVNFAKGLEVRSAVKNECKLLTRLPDYIESYAKNQYGEIKTSAETGSKKGDVLTLEIIDISNVKKNAFAGRGIGQWIGIKGTLHRNGKKIASFKASRATGGGYWGVYKGTCSLLARCTKTLGKDVAGWLKNPVNNAELGDL